MTTVSGGTSTPFLYSAGTQYGVLSADGLQLVAPARNESWVDPALVDVFPMNWWMCEAPNWPNLTIGSSPAMWLPRHSALNSDPRIPTWDRIACLSAWLNGAPWPACAAVASGAAGPATAHRRLTTAPATRSTAALRMMNTYLVRTALGFIESSRERSLRRVPGFYPGHRCLSTLAAVERWICPPGGVVLGETALYELFVPPGLAALPGPAQGSPAGRPRGCRRPPAVRSRAGTHQEGGGELLATGRDRGERADEVVVGQHRPGGHHLGAADDEARV